MGRVEQDLEPWEHLVPEVQLTQGNQRHFSFVIYNLGSSALDIEILEIGLAYKGKELARRARPETGKDWKVTARGNSQIDVVFATDPVSTLRWIEPGLPSNNCIEVEITLILIINGLVRASQRKIYVIASMRNSSMTQYGN